ncbi:MAG: radical SAM protein [bacterium]|nr:radical SAM protein [bacterium]
MYNESGGVFLSFITRESKEKGVIISEISEVFKNVSRETVETDFDEFVKDLEEDKFIITGENLKELNDKEVVFSYDMKNPKTITRSYKDLMKDNDDSIKSTQEILYKYLENDTRLFSIQLELTSKCNERCVHCYIPHALKLDTLPLDTILKVLDEAKEMGLLHVILSGGEPLLHPNIKEIIEHCRKNDFVINILTNATLITDDLIKIFKKNNLDFVQVSVYSMGEEEHDSITQVKGSFKKTVENIGKMIENDIPIQISCPILKQNYKSYKNVLKWAENLKVNANTDFIIAAQTDLSKDNLRNRISSEEVEIVIQDIIENDEFYKEKISLDLKPEKKRIG